MPVEIIGAERLRELITFEDLIEPVSRAFQQSSAGEADNGMLTLDPQADRTKGDVYVKTARQRGPTRFVILEPVTFIQSDAFTHPEATLRHPTLPPRRQKTPPRPALRRVQIQTSLRYTPSASGTSCESGQVVLVKQLSQILSPDAPSMFEKSGLTP